MREDVARLLETIDEIELVAGVEDDDGLLATVDGRATPTSASWCEPVRRARRRSCCTSPTRRPDACTLSRVGVSTLAAPGAMGEWSCGRGRT